MKIARRLGLGVSLGVLLLTSTFAVPGSVVSAAPAPKKAAAPPITTGPQPLCANVTPSCGNNCSNTPFELTKCWTTTYGPAKADVVVVPAGVKPALATKSPNMLSCQGGAYALCFFSGPPTGIAGGQPLPCTLRTDGLVADCTCQYYSSGQYFVDINGILNQGAYYQAVKQCGADGCGCSNIASPGSNCKSSAPQATVCNYVNSQPLGNPATSFYPKGQILSTFSFAMSPPNGNYALATSPSTCHGKYAGCMTAACRFADGSAPAAHKNGDPIQCECPVYDGDYQVGASGQSCTIPSSNGKTYIWSASSTVVAPASTSKK
jgi:hypothetical protein